ncbi:PHD finger-like domain-containing protein 5A isoform X1 [Ciconia boyciana]|uniref:PHD finger-like domain-containing protein 5A isoform X1 n=1 Tax=Ciconia boyciana TaxID=52775 RepID=UPI003BA03B51
MAKHHPDLIFCRKQAGVAIGRLCEKCDGKCVICDSYVRPCTLVRICDECNYGSYQGRCVICGGPGVSDAYYCKECTIQEKDPRTRVPLPAGTLTAAVASHNILPLRVMQMLDSDGPRTNGTPRGIRTYPCSCCE